MLSCQNKSRTRQQFWHFSISKKAQLPAIRRTEQPILLTNRELNCPGYKFSKYFPKNEHLNLILILILVLESKVLSKIIILIFMFHFSTNVAPHPLVLET